MSKQEILAIIPARGGSKGIPRKNIRTFAGYPLIAYSIAAGLQAQTVSRVIVSTEDQEIKEIAQRFGAEVPFLRPADLAEDSSLDLPVFQHALSWLEAHEGYKPGIVVHLRPTTPLRPLDLVDRAVKILVENPGADSVRGLTPAHQNPYKMWLMTGEAEPIKPLINLQGMDEPYNAPRQSLPNVYAHTGLIDVIRPQTILGIKSMSGRTILPVFFDQDYDVDLDTPVDWRRAERRLVETGLSIVWPGKPRRTLPAKVKLLVLDFDGVLTDNRVWVDQEGREMVVANRSDSLWLNRLKDRGIQIYVLSKEKNPVVGARCKKMNISLQQGIDDKAAALRSLLEELQVPSSQAIYCGNDINDLPCFPLVGWAVAVADSVPEVQLQADYILCRSGSFGAVQELCEYILSGSN